MTPNTYKHLKEIKKFRKQNCLVVNLKNIYTQFSLQNKEWTQKNPLEDLRKNWLLSRMIILHAGGI